MNSLCTDMFYFEILFLFNCNYVYNILPSSALSHLETKTQKSPFTFCFVYVKLGALLRFLEIKC
jgi:hypothetical protein